MQESKKDNNMAIKAKPFIKWVGGKTQLIRCIENALPENFADIHNVTYIEPFVGGVRLFGFYNNIPILKSGYQ